MKVKIKKDTLLSLWGLGKKITIDGKRYRIGRMSYGDYFLESGKERGEREPFNEGTKWGRYNKENDMYYFV